MVRYVDADKLKQDLVDLYDFAKWDPREIHFSLFDMVANIDGEPTADVAPVVHAHWEIIYESSAGVTDARCSNCGYESLAYENDVHTDENCNYCPCCGAKMDEEVQ